MIEFQDFSQPVGPVGNRFNWLCRTAYGQRTLPPILALFKPESIEAQARLQ